MNSKSLFFAVLLLFLGTTACDTIQNNTNTSDMLQLSALHNTDKGLSAKSLFKGQEGNATTLQLKKDGLLDKHTTKVPALLVCVQGEVLYEDEKGTTQKLQPGGYLHIEPLVVHWVKGVADSQLLLLK